MIEFDGKILDIESKTSEVKLGDSENIKLTSFDVKKNNLITQFNLDKVKIESNNYTDGVVVSSALAKYYNVEIGDKIKVENPRDEKKKIIYEIKEIANDPLSLTIYMDNTYMVKTLGLKKDFRNAYVVKDTTEKKILKEDKDAKVNKIIDQKNNLDQNLGVIIGMVSFIALIAGAISAITLIVVGGIIVNNNSKTISILRVLGYNTKEIKDLTTGSYKYIITAVYFLSIPIVEKLINTLIDTLLKDTDFTFTISIDWKFALLGYIVIILVYLISMARTERRISKVLLSESLKADE